MYSTHAVCHATTNPMFRSCMELSSSSPVIENCQCRGRESVSDSISAIEALTSMWIRLCTHYIDDLLPYEQLCSYWACGQVFHNNNNIIVSGFDKRAHFAHFSKFRF